MVMAVNPAMSEEQVLYRSWNTGTQTNYTWYTPTLMSGYARAARVEVDWESEVGTTTLDVEAQYYSQANGEWTDWLDGAGTVLKLNNYADGETGRRWMEIGIGSTGGADADKVLVVGNNVYYDTSLMPEWRLKFTIGGTAVSGVISASVYWKN